METDMGVLCAGIGTMESGESWKLQEKHPERREEPGASPWGKPGSAKWAEGRSREESEEEPFQEGGKQGHKAGGSAGEKETPEVRGGEGVERFFQEAWLRRLGENEAGQGQG